MNMRIMANKGVHMSMLSRQGIWTLVLLVGCASTSHSGRQKDTGDPSSDPMSGGKKEITITAKGGALKLDPKEYVTRELDRNNDKKADIVNVYKKVKNAEGKDDEQLFIKIIDLNLDGKHDVHRFYDESGAVLKEELDLDFDGKIETTDHYLGGIVVKKEIDSQFDEKTDLWKYYDDKGVLIKLEEDQDGDGRVDYWESYTGGVLERVEKDTDRDGRPDVFKRAGDLKFTPIIRNEGAFDGGAKATPRPADAPDPAPQEAPDTPKDAPKEEPKEEKTDTPPPPPSK